MYGYNPNYYVYAARSVNPSLWTPSVVELDRKLRSLWVQHIYWTRLTFNSIVGELPNEKETMARLLRNPDDFGTALEPLYGPEISAMFGRLLRDHLRIAAEIVKALKTDQFAAASDAKRRWFANADDIAIFLSQINPYWSEERWKSELYEHLKLLNKEIASLLAGNYDDNIALNDPIESRAMEMADEMTDGIVRQFPTVFVH